MPNHLHLIAAGSQQHSLSATVRDFKHFTARKIVEELQRDGRTNELMIFQKAALEQERGNTYKIWIDGTHPILLEEGYMFKEKLQYIHNNPVRKGYISEPEHWIYSSARNYINGDHSVLRVECLE